MLLTSFRPTPLLASDLSELCFSCEHATFAKLAGWVGISLGVVLLPVRRSFSWGLLQVNSMPKQLAKASRDFLQVLTSTNWGYCHSSCCFFLRFVVALVLWVRVGLSLKVSVHKAYWCRKGFEKGFRLQFPKG